MIARENIPQKNPNRSVHWSNTATVCQKPALTEAEFNAEYTLAESCCDRQRALDRFKQKLAQLSLPLNHPRTGQSEEDWLDEITRVSELFDESCQIENDGAPSARPPGQQVSELFDDCQIENDGPPSARPPGHQEATHLPESTITLLMIPRRLRLPACCSPSPSDSSPLPSPEPTHCCLRYDPAYLLDEEPAGEYECDASWEYPDEWSIDDLYDRPISEEW
eukprot:NODE_3730_length_912_cov_7.440764_g3578_i0.p1 GENE.NODE_3730_length_912_cov_7.440764_g3578_i0~~NODE_3730_length_912_cov_7.440764_g3578_i0.p1  ORF type:complete len:247 (-),score=25.17 NODE_3730_length_912_cov_7.440764_g3578_i0:172-834(-)